MTGLVLLAWAPPLSVSYRTGVMGAATPLMTDTGIRQVLSVEVDGRTRHATTRAQLVHPAPGEAVCLARTRHLLGRVTFALADQRLCAGR